MTKPIPSFVEYRGKEYTILGFGGAPRGIFDLIGVEPNGMNTAGNFSATFSVSNQQLLIKNVELVHSVNHDELADMPQLNSRKAEGIFSHYDKLNTEYVRYKDVNLLFEYSGYLAIGRKMARRYGGSRMLPPIPSMYKIVRRLSVTDGFVTLTEDMSKQAKAIRDKYNSLDREFRKLSKKDKTIDYSNFKSDERTKLWQEERCIEDPTNCD